MRLNSDNEICNCTVQTPCVDNCINFRSNIECDKDSCPAMGKCLNQRFRCGPKFKTEVKMTSEKGYGLFAGEEIPANSFIIEYIGEVIGEIELKSRDWKLKKIAASIIFSLLAINFISTARKKATTPDILITHVHQMPNLKNGRSIGEKELDFFQKRPSLR